MRFRFDVVSPILHPVPARTGDVLVACPGDAELPLTVVRKVRGRWTGIRVGPPNFGALAGLLADGVICPRSPAAARWLQNSA
jgi:hypothetical protein